MFWDEIKIVRMYNVPVTVELELKSGDEGVS